MAEFEKNEFKFPDEVGDESNITLELEGDENVEIEVVDDTPAQDRGRKPLDREVADPTDEELNEYSSKVQKRMKELTHKSHDERRKAEALYREKTELERAAQALAAENKRLQEYVNVGQHAYIDKSKSLASVGLNAAKVKFKAAFDAGDSDALAEAQQEMYAAQRELDEANNFKPTPLRESEQSAYTQPTTAARDPHETLDNRVVGWANSNPWFQRPGDEDMTGFAYSVHNRLVQDYGQEYVRTDEYYNKIDAAMRKAFPKRFGIVEVDTEDAPPSRQTRPNNVVAPAQRATAPKKIRLSLTQQNVAKKLGIPLELYAKKVAELEAQNG
jgi:arsenate reductase-like glutaredoxin family protein